MGNQLSGANTIKGVFDGGGRNRRNWKKPTLPQEHVEPELTVPLCQKKKTSFLPLLFEMFWEFIDLNMV